MLQPPVALAGWPDDHHRLALSAANATVPRAIASSRTGLLATIAELVASTSRGITSSETLRRAANTRGGEAHCRAATAESAALLRAELASGASRPATSADHEQSAERPVGRAAFPCWIASGPPATSS